MLDQIHNQLLMAHTPKMYYIGASQMLYIHTWDCGFMTYQGRITSEYISDKQACVI